MPRWTSWSGWTVEEADLDRGQGPARLIRVTHNGAPQGWGSPGLPRGWYRTVDDVHAGVPGLPWDEMEEQESADPECE